MLFRSTLIAYILFAVLNYYYMNKICKDKLDGATVYNVKRLSIMGVIFTIIILIALMGYPYPLLRWGMLVVIVIVVLLNMKKILTLINESMK